MEARGRGWIIEALWFIKARRRNPPRWIGGEGTRIEIQVKICLIIARPFLWLIYREEGLQAPGTYSASFWINNFSILLLQNLNFHDFWIFGTCRNLHLWI